MATGDIARRFIISGKVQGVFFRASTAREARRLGLCGHAINLTDGKVEVMAVGDAAAIEELGRWLQRGPPSARVERIDVRDEMPVDIKGFRTG
jgi:acylphosphatase